MRCALLALVALFAFLCSAEQRGYWWQTWLNGHPPGDTNMGFAFTGDVKIQQAIDDSKSVQDKLPGEKYITLGGGDNDGRWSADFIDQAVAAIRKGS
jgi:hypothetical protein